MLVLINVENLREKFMFVIIDVSKKEYMFIKKMLLMDIRDRSSVYRISQGFLTIYSFAGEP